MATTTKFTIADQVSEAFDLAVDLTGQDLLDYLALFTLEARQVEAFFGRFTARLLLVTLTDLVELERRCAADLARLRSPDAPSPSLLTSYVEAAARLGQARRSARTMARLLG